MRSKKRRESADVFVSVVLIIFPPRLETNQERKRKKEREVMSSDPSHQTHTHTQRDPEHRLRHQELHDLYRHADKADVVHVEHVVVISDCILQWTEQALSIDICRRRGNGRMIVVREAAEKSAKLVKGRHPRPSDFLG